VAVYTEVTDEELTAFLATYDIGTVLSYKGIAEGRREHELFPPHHARLLHPDPLREAGAGADLPFFLGLMQHLAARGLNCPLPVQNRAGRRSGRVRRPAAIATFLDGRGGQRPDRGPLRGARQALAQLHLAGATSR
jgi:homoserine kinase type II